MKAEYDEMSPLTENFCVIAETDERTGVTSYMCMETGFATTDVLLEGSEQQEKYESTITKLMLDCKFVDMLDRAWYPAFIHAPAIAMLFCEGTSHDDLLWTVAPEVSMVGEERKKYPVPGKENEYYTHRIDMQNAVTFPGNEFTNALDHMYQLTAAVTQDFEDSENIIWNNEA